MEDFTQHEKILIIMLRHYVDNKQATWWRASDFQTERYGIFIGYEATARMSELFKKYPFMFNQRTNKRFRELQLINTGFRENYDKLPHFMGRHLVRAGLI